jgi:predicted permease
MAALHRLLRLFRRPKDDREVQDELQFHLDMEADDIASTGVARADARRQARMRLGGVEGWREQARETRRTALLETLAREARYGLRALARTKGFSLVVLLVLAIGIGATTAGFVLVHRILLQPLPFAGSDRFVRLTHRASGLGANDVGLSGGLYAFYKKHARSLQSLAVYTRSEAGVRLADGQTERVQMTYAGAGLFEMFGVKPVAGRLFTREDGRPGFMNVTWTLPVLLSHDYWATRYGADPNIVGQTILLNDRPRQIVGVLPSSFRYPEPDTKIWVLFELQGPDFSELPGSFARSLSYSAVGKLAPGATPKAAQAELEGLLPGIVGQYPDATPERFAEVQLAPRVRSLKDDVVGSMATALWTVFGAMACLLGIAVANAGSLFAIRAEHRHREVVLRRALGAQPAQITRLFFVEAVALTGLAAVIGLVLAAQILRAVLTLGPFSLPRSTELVLGVPAVAFALLLALGIAFFYGRLALWSRDAPVAVTRAGAGSRPRRGWLREPLLTAQIMLALGLVTGSFLMAETYRNLANTTLGFNPARLLIIDVGLASRRYAETSRIYSQVIERVTSVPGVIRASAASSLPLMPSASTFPVNAPGIPVAFRFFLPGYFQTIGTGVTEGHAFTDQSSAGWESPVLVSATLARRLYPGGSAVGKPLTRLEEDGSPVTIGRTVVAPFTIAGIVDDTVGTTMRGEGVEIVYVPVIDPPVERSISAVNMKVIVRTQGDSNALARAVSQAVVGVDRSLTVGQIRTMDSVVTASRGLETFIGALLLGAAGLSLALGVLGIYGSVAHGVAGRTREIAVRLALGATRGGALRVAALGSLRTVAIGLGAGLLMTLLLSRALEGVLFGVEPADPVVLALALGCLACSSTAAAFAAALRAAKISPSSALRGD